MGDCAIHVDLEHSVKLENVGVDLAIHIFQLVDAFDCLAVVSDIDGACDLKSLRVNVVERVTTIRNKKFTVDMSHSPTFPDLVWDRKLLN